MSFFDGESVGQARRVGLDSRLDPTELLFTVYLLGEGRATRVSLTEARPLVVCEGHTLSVIDECFYLDDEPCGVGLAVVGQVECLVIPAVQARTVTFVPDNRRELVIGDSPEAAIRITSSPTLVIRDDLLIVEPNYQRVFVDDVVVSTRQACTFPVGTVVLTEGFMVERRPTQLKITTFGFDAEIDHTKVLVQPPAREFPEGFPGYRRSPKLNLEVEEAEYRLQEPDQPQKQKKNGLLRMVLPPFVMIAVSAATAVMTGGNPTMMLSMGLATLLTASFTVSQHVTERRETKAAALKAEKDYEHYLVQAVAEVTHSRDLEAQVLGYQQPSPHQLAELVDTYDSRIYERQRFNRDFLNVSLGYSDPPSAVKVTCEVNGKDTSEQARHVAELVEGFQTQHDAPTPIGLAEQTLGFVGPQDVVDAQLQSLLFQVAFFHSYRDVNFIGLFSPDTYRTTWGAWRLLPHFTLQELNMRGLIHNEKLRDIVLNGFYQVLQKRKQMVKDAGTEHIQFTPHYLFAICDDQFLAGHGINELLAEDMSELGVTVIWCSEDAKLLPETVTALIQAPHQVKGELVTNQDVYVATPFTPYALPEQLELSLRKLANLNHLEVEKNLIPEALSLLAQYEVETVEDLRIAQRWAEAEPNKSMASLIGWRGRSDYVYWDLHERAHGPHALVGGTTGSGKSEFLTTYLIGLAINFSPEDVGMLIIDWKGGGIANTLDQLPHFMGAITNLDGAGTARALASIKAELNKRQREFAKYGVNSINAYMGLYKQRLTPKPDITYPDKPLPHLVLVSDEFAELKANVPEFLDELTSVARIGRSLGVHLILATQKPSGVVNDQIEANSTSKIALKMASEQDSKELLKSTDAAHITNPGRGYLRVGQNEVYELFQSGYAGIPYDPGADTNEQVDERIYTINEVGQRELFYDPGEDIQQGTDTSDLPTQLEAVIETIVSIATGDSRLTIPDKPWLPSLPESIASPHPTTKEMRVPLGLLDIPSRQAQEDYQFDLPKAGHTILFGSPGYGKSTVLQTLTLNLAKTNTPEQLHVNLIDFGNNGLLPLVDLPHVADLVTLEEAEKLSKMLGVIADQLATRKQLFRDAGAANLEQYKAKTRQSLPVVVNVLDGYDNLTGNDARKEGIDSVLLQVLREGAALGVYLVISASRLGSVRMNMLSNISTKMCLYLNEESEVAQLMGRERLVQSGIPGRGQILTDVPTAIQFYLPAQGVNGPEILRDLEKQVAAMDGAWLGERPLPIPMVPQELTTMELARYAPQGETRNRLLIGLNKRNAEPESFELFRGDALAVFPDTGKQAALLYPFLMGQISGAIDPESVVVIDAHDTLAPLFAGKSSLYIGKKGIKAHGEALKDAFVELIEHGTSVPQCLLISGMTDVFETIMFPPNQSSEFLGLGSDLIQIIVLDHLSKVTGSFGMIGPLKENVQQILFGGDLGAQRFIDNLPMAVRKETHAKNVLHSLMDGELEHIVVPTAKESKG